jgi:hypothetical protein
MTPQAARWLTRLYPWAWRERYGEEFEELLETGPGGLRTVVNSIWSALVERIFPTVGGNMNPSLNSFGRMIQRPSAFIPLTMSSIALVTVLIAVAWGFHQTGHVDRDSDEGSIAHIFQLLMSLQVPIVLFFAIKWLRRAPRQTLGVLALQAGAWLAACAPVFYFNL